MTRQSIFAAALSLALLACAQEGPDAPDLELDTGKGSVSGSFVQGDQEVEFSGTQLAEGRYEFVFQLNGMTLMETADRNEGVIVMDGFTTATGESTRMTAEDRAAMAALVDEIELLGDNVPEIVSLTRASADWFSQASDGMELQQEIYFEMSKSVVCAAWNAYNWASHDCSTGGYGADNTTLNGGAYVGYWGACGSSEDGGTYFWNGSTWVCYEPNHDPNIEYGHGNCFGRCGAACGGESQWTIDCMEHDLCVRFGHSLGSGWCSDELLSVADDKLSSSCKH